MSVLILEMFVSNFDIDFFIFYKSELNINQFYLNFSQTIYSHSYHLSSSKPGHTTRGSCRHGTERTAARSDAVQKKVPTFRSPLNLTAPLSFQRNVNLSNPKREHTTGGSGRGGRRRTTGQRGAG